MTLNREAPAGENWARARQEIAAVEGEPMGIRLGDLHRELLVDVIAQRRLDERIRVADEIVLDRMGRVMEHPVNSPASSCTPGRGRVVGGLVLRLARR